MKRYVLVTIMLTLGLCLVVGLFNYRVDPYAIYHFRRANAEWLSRVDQFHFLRISKPWQVLQRKPTAIVIGTSRTASVPPMHSSWPKNRGYNLSVPAMTLYETLRFIEHAQAAEPLSKLMIGLDFETFVRPEPRSRSGFEEARLAHHHKDLASLRLAWQFLGDVRDTLFSIPAATRSLAALTHSEKVGRRYETDGTWESTTSTLSGRAGFVYMGRNTFNALDVEQSSLDDNLEVFADILRFAHQQKIDTRLFITPEHVFMIDLWWRLGYGDLWKEFHRRLVEVNETVAAQMGVEAFPLFGFNHVEKVADERIPMSVNSERSLFVDGTHFRKLLGKRIMHSVWSDDPGQGVNLAHSSLDTYFSQVSRIRYNFVKSNATLTARLRREISPALEYPIEP
jgi:hypothetical protein